MTPLDLNRSILARAFWMAVVLVVLCIVMAIAAKATNYNAASLSPTDVQAAMNMATGAGDTVRLPAGTLAWTTGGVAWTAPINSQLIGAGTTNEGGSEAVFGSGASGGGGVGIFRYQFQ